MHRVRAGFAVALAFWLTACTAQEGTTAVQTNPLQIAAEGGAASAPAPEQRWGDAAGLDPVVDGKRNTYRPESLRARYPVVKASQRKANTARTTAAPTAKVSGFRTDSSKEIPSRRTSHERTYENADGTETTEFSASPLNYRKADGSWAAVDSTLVRDPAGGWRRSTDAVGLWLADRADAAELVRVTLPGGGVLAYRAERATGAAAAVRGDTARYPGAWPGVDIELQAQPGGVKETLVLANAEVPETYVFPLRLTGLTAAADGTHVVLRDANGQTVATIPAGTMVDADGAVSDAVTYRLIDRDGKPALQVSADAAWLADERRAFPVRLDPPVLANGAASESLIVDSNGSHGGGDLAVGYRNGVNSAAYLRFGGLVSALANETVYSAQLVLASLNADSCKPRPLTVHPVTGSWTSGTSTSYPGPAVGAALASRSFAQGYVGFNQAASSCPVTGTVIDLGTKGRDLVQGWANGKANNGISLRAKAGDSSAWKSLAGTSAANPPKLYVTHSPYNAKYSIANPTPNPAVLQNQAGKVKVRVTNKSAMDWTPAGFQLVYRVYNAATNAKVGQYVAAPLTATVARGAGTTLEATIRALPLGSYLVDFSMATTSGKVFTDELVPPARIALTVENIQPTVPDMFPPNWYPAPTLTPQLWAQGVDLDAPPSQTLQYRFEYCAVTSADQPTGCTVTAYQAKDSYVIPAGKLKWSTKYVWRAYVKDNASEVVTAYLAMVTTAPQPEITSRVANAPYGSAERDFNPDIGNYSTAAVDAAVATAGPALNVTRSYNSLDPRRDLAFGAGWMSQIDMRLTADPDGSGNVLVTYADGQQVRFGRNPDGTFAAPPGRTAQLTIANGLYVLRDLANTTYTFRSDGKLNTIADKYGRNLEFVYTSDGRLQRIQAKNGLSSNPGRKLSFGWNTAGTRVTSVSTDPVNGAALTWTYEYTGDLLTRVCAPGAQACTVYAYAAGSHYRSGVLDSGPDSYWRLGEKAGATAGGSEIANNLGKDAATLRNVTLEQPGALLGTEDTAALFNGTTSVAELPKGVVKRSRDTSVELWFKVSLSQAGGPLLGYQDTAVDGTPTTGVPLLYVDANGHVRGQFKNTAAAPDPMDGGVDLRNDQWHHVVLTVSGDVQTLYVDGEPRESKPATDGALDHGKLTFNQVGVAWATNPATWPAWGSTNAKRYFNGTVDEVAVYGRPLTEQQVKAHRQLGLAQADQLSAVTLPSGKIAAEVAYDSAVDRVTEYTDGNGGTWKIGNPTVYGGDSDLRRAVRVLDPADRAYLYEYDALAGRLLRSGSPLGIDTRPEDRPLPTAQPTPTPTTTCTSPDPGYPQFCTTIPADSGGPIFVENELTGMVVRSFEYDEKGRQKLVVDELGHTLKMTYDDRGNVRTRETCRDAGDCQTTYTTYTTPNPNNPFDPKNDLPVEVRDARSSSATDNTYRTQTTYTTAGDVDTETGPDSATTRTVYTSGNEIGYGSTTETAPGGLISSVTDAMQKVVRYRYNAHGDLALVTAPSGLVTEYTYDEIGRKKQEKVTSDSYPSGVITTFAYDSAGRPTTTTGPVTTNAVDGSRHQAVTTQAYDLDGNVQSTSVRDALDPNEPERVTTIEYDDFNRPTRTVNPEGDEQTEGWDRFGNRTSVVDGNGNHYEYAYTAQNKIAEVRLYDFHDEGTTADDDYVVLNSYAYDYGGRMAAQLDSMGRRVEYQYFHDDLLKKVVLKNFHDPAGTTRDYVLEEHRYDKAGNAVWSSSDDGSHVTENVVDVLGRTKSTNFDPGGLSRYTVFGYDPLGNTTTTTSTGNAVNVPWPVPADAANVATNVYNATTGLLEQEKAVAGADSRITSYTYDQRGLKLSTVDPRGNVAGADKTAYTTRFRYDENGDQTTVVAPAVSVESGGNPAQTVNPTVTTGYNAFGEAVMVKDALGNISRTKYDRMGRVVETSGPQYTAPAGPNVSGSSVVKTRYDALGNAVETTDAKQHVTGYTYDRLNRVVQVDRPGATDSERLITKHTYTRTGKLRSTVTPTGIRSEATYDDLDRQITATVFERKPVARTLTTRFTYDDAGNVVQTESPGKLLTKATYDAAGNQLTVTDPNGVTTAQGYDGFGNPVRQSDGAGRTTRRDFNLFGNVVAEINLDPSGAELRRETYEYDAGDNVVSRTDQLKKTVTFGYNALDQLIKQVEPTSDTHAITTTFGYDASGHRTRYTDGRNNPTYYTVNTLGLTESVIEPSTAAHPALTDRTWTVAYDLNGNPATLVAPGGVIRSREYDAANRVIGETGSGGGAAAANRGMSYDLEGRTKVVTGGGGASATTFDYDDRGGLLSATGTNGDSSFTYDDDGNLTGRTDVAGTATFGYTKGRLTTVKDGSSAVTQTLGYDAAGQVKTVDYGAGRVRTYGYDNLGRFTSDVLKNGTGTTVSSIGYEYDLADHVVGKDTTGTVGAGENTYGYDYAGRLTSWTSGAGKVDYAYDDSGNLIRAGDKTATYDARNRLLSDGDYTYTYTPRGTMATRTSSGLTDTYTFDALDRMVGAEGETYVYDGLDRVVNRNGTLFQYAGTDDDPVSDGTEKYARGPDGELLAVSSAADGVRLTLSDQHDDVVGSFAAGSSLTGLDGSAAYDPYGGEIATTGTQANVGYQGDWTDPATGQVDMGARWYEPDTGAFLSRDTVDYTTGASVLANKYAYAADDPMGNNDPTGNWPSCGWCRKAISTISSGVSSAVSYAWNAGRSAVASAGTWLYNQARAGWSAIKRGLSKAYNATKNFLNRAKNAIVNTWNKKVMPALRSARDYARQKAVAAYRAGRAVTQAARNKIVSTIKNVPLKRIGAMVKGQLKSLKLTISSAIPAAIVQSYSNVVQDFSAAAQKLYQGAQAAGDSVVSGLSAAGDWVVEHKAEIAGAVAGTVVGLGCGALIGWTGVGAIACGAVAGAVGSLVTDAVKGDVGWKDMAANALMGAVAGAVLGPLASVGGSALSGGARALLGGGMRAAISGGRAAAASSLRSFSSGEVGGVVGRAMATRAASREAVETTGASARPAARISECNSFAAGTLVLMADGAAKPIQDVRVGDKVTATDPTTGRTEARRVTALIIGAGEKQMVELSVDEGGQGTIQATEGHPFWVPGLNRWVTAGDLRPGTLLQTGAGTYVQVTATRKWTADQAQVHNLTVDGLHTYHVLAGNTPALVHNCDLGTAASDQAVAHNRASLSVHGSDGFSGVYDPASGVFQARLSGGPNALVDQFGGHAQINREVFGGSRSTVGFAVINRGDGALQMRWNSRSVNQRNFGDRAAPMEHRNAIMDAIRSATGMDVVG